MKNYVLYIMLVAVAAAVIRWKTTKVYDEAKDMSTVSKVFAKYALDENATVKCTTG